MRLPHGARRSRPPQVARLFFLLIIQHIAFVLSLCQAISLPQEVFADEQLTLEIPEEGAYSGAYVDFGEREDTVTPASLKNYEKMVGQKQAIIGFSSDWGNLNFPSKQLKVIDSYGAVALIYWSPFDRPLGAPQARNRFGLRKILSGEWDSYIDEWAAKAKEYKKPLLVAWGLEMNGEWFPWSGAFYGAGQRIGTEEPPKYEGPEMFKTVYRYVVDRVRAVGAHNIAWVFHANNTSDPSEPWNAVKNYYPGSDYVDWLGMSAYGQQYPDQGWAPFDIVLPKACETLGSLDPEKPMILAEWGIGEFPESGDKAAWLDEAFKRIPVDCPRVKAAVYWHERWKNGNGLFSNLRVNSSPKALQAFRRGIASDFWIDRPTVTAGEGSDDASANDPEE